MTTASTSSATKQQPDVRFQIRDMNCGQIAVRTTPEEALVAASNMSYMPDLAALAMDEKGILWDNSPVHLARLLSLGVPLFFGNADATRFLISVTPFTQPA